MFPRSRLRRLAGLALLLLTPLALSSGCAAFTALQVVDRLWQAALTPQLGAPGAPPDWAPEQRQLIEAAMAEAYRRGAGDALRQMVEGLGRDPRWTWAAPVVQEVWLPPQIVNAVYIPGHREWVLIRPGFWQAQFGLPLGPGPAVPAPPAPRIPSPWPPPSARALIPGQNGAGR